MIVILCADDNLGLRFNHRRQSRDRVVCERILALTEGSALYMTEKTAKLFSKEAAARIQVTEDPLKEAGIGAYCFLEMGPLLPCRDRIEQLILFRWNRNYPSDEKLDLAMDSLQLVSSEDFAGYSHEKITREVYLLK